LRNSKHGVDNFSDREVREKRRPKIQPNQYTSQPMSKDIDKRESKKGGRATFSRDGSGVYANNEYDKKLKKVGKRKERFSTREGAGRGKGKCARTWGQNNTPDTFSWWRNGRGNDGRKSRANGWKSDLGDGWGGEKNSIKLNTGKNRGSSGKHRSPTPYLKAATKLAKRKVQKLFTVTRKKSTEEK